MNDRSAFAANLVTAGPLPDGAQHVGWAADGSGDGPHLILMRDDDGLCVVSGDQDTYVTHYGGVIQVQVTQAVSRVQLTTEAAAALTLPELVVITHHADVLDPPRVQERVDRLLLG